MPGHTLRRSRVLRWWVPALIVTLFVALTFEASFRLGVTPWAETLLTDQWHTLAGEDGALDEVPVVLVVMDEETLERHTDPMIFWAPLLADVVGKLRAHGASVQGLDFLMRLSPGQWLAQNGFDEVSRNITSPLLMEVARGDTVLVASLKLKAGDDQNVYYDLPADEFAILVDPVANIGLASVTRGRDDTVRRFQPVLLPHLATTPHLSFALALALHHVDQDPRVGAWELGGRAVLRDESVQGIRYYGPPGSIPSIPMWRVLADELTDEEWALLDGKVAILGATHTAAHDEFATPYSRYATRESHEYMAGPEIQATQTANLLMGRSLDPLTGWLRLPLLVLASLVLSLLGFGTTSPRVWVSVALLWGVLVPVGLFAFVFADTIFPVLHVAGAGTLAFGATWPLRYSQERRQRRFLEGVFSRYVSGAVVEDILSSETGLGLGGARRHMTVLFSDIRNFTTYSEILTAEETVEMLNAYFGRVCRPILEQGGVVDKFIGDAVMAVFGVPIQSEVHPRLAIQAALGMSQQADSFKVWLAGRFPGRGLPEFEIGIGIHTGHAVAGNVGFELRTEYTVVGDTVNTASRIEGLTKGLACRILISRETLDAAGPAVITGRSSQLQVKGRHQPVEVFEVLGLEGI